MTSIGILHPGQMGISVAAACIESGHQAFWCPQGRSDASRVRAEAHGLLACDDLQVCTDTCDMLISVCPPSAAIAQAEAVAATGFDGIYVDANAVSPQSAEAIAVIFSQTDVRLVDAGIIGPPAHQPQTTRLYLSGEDAPGVLACFSGSKLEAIDLQAGVGAASALKMAYAGWTKGSGALLLSMYSVASSYGVEQALDAEWQLSLPQLPQRLRRTAEQNAPKAWRFVGEMHEIGKTLEQAGLPPEWFVAAAETYARLQDFKNAEDVSLADVMQALVQERG